MIVKDVEEGGCGVPHVPLRAGPVRVTPQSPQATEPLRVAPHSPQRRGSTPPGLHQLQGEAPHKPPPSGEAIQSPHTASPVPAGQPPLRAAPAPQGLRGSHEPSLPTGSGSVPLTSRRCRGCRRPGCAPPAPPPCRAAGGERPRREAGTA